MFLRNNHTIGVIVSNLDNPYFVDVVRAIETEAHRAGYETRLANTNYSPDQLATSFDLMLGRRVAGIAAIVSEMRADLSERLGRGSTPVVVSGVRAPVRGINIQVNCRKGIDRAVQHPRDLGHGRMAFADHHSGLESISDRRRAFTEQVSRSGEEFRTFSESDNLEGGRQTVRDLLASGFQAAAVVCVNEYSEYSTPALTTVHIPRDRIGTAAFECRLQEPGKEIVIDPELIVRKSTGTVAD